MKLAERLSRIRFALLEQHTHFATNQLIYMHIVEFDGYGSIYSFFSKITSQKFIISCWNESVYYRYISLYLPKDALLACLLSYIRSTRGSQ